MKTRIITGAILVLVVSPFVGFGGYAMAAFVAILFGIGMYELLNIKKKANLEKIPIYIYILSAIFGLLMIFDIPYISEYAIDYTNNALLYNYGINILWLALFIVTIFTASLFDEKYSLIDVLYTFTTIIYLVIGLKGLLYLRSYENNQGLLLVIYVLLVTCITDIFAYFGGMTCYKILGNDKVHKLNERISPKKTIEGTIIGTIFDIIAGFIFAMCLFNKVESLPIHHWAIYLLLSFIVSIVGQIGDLILSSIKRYFAVKDYSKLLPGHGGLLDRIDSLLINCMATATFLSLLTFFA